MFGNYRKNILYLWKTINNMERTRTTPIGKVRMDKTISDFIRLVTGNRICYDESIQRRQVWTKRNETEYKKCLLLGKDVSNIVMADVRSCMDLALGNKSTYDYEYFSNLYNKGTRYVSIDGGNRTRFLMNLYDSQDWRSGNVDDEMFDFFDLPISVVVISNATKLDLHDIASYLNSGESWNKQEKRNASYGMVSDFVRKWGNTYSETFKLIKGVTFPRMKDLELFTHLLAYHQYNGLSLSNKTLDNLFKCDEIFNEKLFLDTLKTWSKCVHIIHDTNSDIGKSFSFNLFMYLLDMNRSYNTVINKDKINGFVEKYLELENNRIKNTFNKPPKENWTNINRNIAQYMVLKFNTIYNDMLPYVTEYFYILDNVRTFSSMEKIAKCIETNGVVVRLDGSTEVITPLQSTNGKVVHGNHKEIPHSKGGPTTIENLNLMVPEDNIRLSNNY